MSAPRVLVSGAVLGQPAGGVRRHNAELLPRVARRLALAGGALAVIEGREKIAFPLPLDVERIASDVPARPPLVRALHEGRALRAALARAQRAQRPFDLVHSAHLPVPRRLSVPYTLTIHDLRGLAGRHTRVARRFFAQGVIRGAIERAALVITVSESVKSELLNRFQLAAERVCVVPNAADHFEPLPRRPARDAPLLCVGHLEPRKNLELVLRALALARGSPRLLLAGAAKRGEEVRLRALAVALGIAERVTFLGAFDDRDLPRLYAEAACVVLPSRIEGFGIAALEAQRARAPLAIARIAALVEVAGPATPSFSPDDPAECAHAIESARAATGDALDAAARAAERFSWERSAQLWFEAFTAAAGARR